MLLHLTFNFIRIFYTIYNYNYIYNYKKKTNKIKLQNKTYEEDKMCGKMGCIFNSLLISKKQRSSIVAGLQSMLTNSSLNEVGFLDWIYVMM